MESNVEVHESHNEQYTTLRKEGYALRRKLLSGFDYIFRNDTEVKTALANIREGRGDLDMFKDLLSLHKLSVDYGERLEKAHFSLDESQRAYVLYSDLFNLSAQRDIDPEKVSDAKLLCIKSWALLWEALEEIYAAGRYVFYNDAKVEELFYTDYWQKISAKQNKSSSTSQENTTGDTSTTVAEEIPAA